MTTEKKPAEKATTAPRETAAEEATPTPKAEVKRSALAEELEALKAQGNPDPERLAELKKLLAASG